MYQKKHFWVFICLTAFLQIVTLFPRVVETVYSQGIYPLFLKLMYPIVSRVSFSLAGIVMIVFALFLLTVFIKAIWTRKVRWLSIINGCLFVYVSFMLAWGLHYHRMPLNQVLDFDLVDANHENIVDVTQAIIEQAKSVRSRLQEDDSGVFQMGMSPQALFLEGEKGWNFFRENHPRFNVPVMRGKPVLFSNLMVMTRITGIYFPFTTEPNVNTAIPDLLMPATLLHEQAHYMGIAHEDQANFMSYLVGLAHPNPIFSYSVHVLALFYLMDTIKTIDYPQFLDLEAQYSDAMRRDIEHYHQFWLSVPRTFSSLSNTINDVYLKINRQSEGIQSYRMMVVWLVSYHRVYPVSRLT